MMELEGVGEERKEKGAGVFREVGKPWKERQRFPGQLQFRAFHTHTHHMSFY